MKKRENMFANCGDVKKLVVAKPYGKTSDMKNMFAHKS